MNEKFDAIILGAGPAGLAGAHKLIKNSKKVIVFEKDNQVGGISKTISFNHFLFDLGPHRFFTKSDEVNNLWRETLGNDLSTIPRLTRIYYRNKFFNYPLKPLNALFGLGIIASIGVIMSYIKVKLSPYKEEINFEQWTTNRFGKKLYKTFFKTYTEKLWGISCREMQAEWVAQRIKGLSLRTAIINALFPEKGTRVKTLIDEFSYPKYGAGMMYEKMAENLVCAGALISTETEVVKIIHNDSKIEKVVIRDKNKNELEYSADHFISSIPMTILAQRLSPSAPPSVIAAARKLNYRSTLFVNLIMDLKNSFPDNWIYVHSPEAKTGRISNPKNWSRSMVPDKGKTTLCLEYFCTEGDEIWIKEDADLIQLALEDLEKLNLAKKSQFSDGFIVRAPKTYPVYNSIYQENLKIIRNYLKKFANLQLIGRYGMFKYNNMDHSILTGIYAAENILGKNHNIWDVNADQEYHEEK